MILLSLNSRNPDLRPLTIATTESSSFLWVGALPNSARSSHGSQVTVGDRFFFGSYAQVATSVAQVVRQKSCGLKPDQKAEKKSGTHGVRFQPGELALVKAKADIAGIVLNTYIRASALGSDYTPPINPELQKLLLKTNRELTAQGNNLNQIAKRLHLDKITNAQAMAMIDSIRVPLVRALLTIKNALVQGTPPN